MANFGIGKSTVSDINKNREKIRSFSCEMVDMGMKKQGKVMKVSDDKHLDQAVFLWKSSKGVPINGSILYEKAIELSKILQGEHTNFKASEGWKWAKLVMGRLQCLNHRTCGLVIHYAVPEMLTVFLLVMHVFYHCQFP